MPTCLASSSGLLRSSAQHHSSHFLARATCAQRYRAPGSAAIRRAASTAATSKHEEQRAHVLTVLHKATSLLPRILPSSKPGSQEVPPRESLGFWEEVLGKVYEHLTPSAEQREKDRVRVVVYGTDWMAGANELVTALLEDPFVSDEQKQTLRSRWKAQPEGSRSVTIRYGTSPSADGDVVYIQSSWLQNFGVPVEVTEFKSPATGVLPDRELAKALFTADVPIILCNPISTPVATTATYPTLPLSRDNTVLAILSPSPAHPATAAHGHQGGGLASLGNVRIVFVDPARALHGLEMLDSGVASPLAVQRYQDDFSGSNISSITHAVKELLSHDSTSVPPSARVVAVHAQTGRALIKDALATSRAVLRKAELEADAVLTAKSALRGQMEEAKAKVHLEVFGAEGKDGDEIAKAVAQAKKSVQPTMDALQWYKLFWRVDDVREVVMAAVDRAWCRDLERKVCPSRGIISATVAADRIAPNSLCRSFKPASAYHSPVLHNTLARIASAPSYPITATALTSPLHARQSQLGFPTERLHASAQRAVVDMSGSVLGGFGIAWAGWATELQLTETALGVGMLSAAVGVRWAVGRWEKAKRRWWKNWDRIGEGLERDLKGTLSQTMEEHVVVVSEAACAGLEGLVAKRKVEVEELQDEVQALEMELSQRRKEVVS
ncbi:hypothetical protein C8T65DRAFT_653159 [Cerioporus squamosus]|nr:hypothetical protein C8T65DRAFT_653159 [Cerioporus squamosus]